MHHLPRGELTSASEMFLKLLPGLHFFYKNLCVLNKTRNDLKQPLKPSKTIWNHPGITWNKPGNNRYPLKPAISHKFSSRIWNTVVELRDTELRDSANRMYLFKVLRRQITGIINIINVVAMSFLLLTLILVFAVVLVFLH